MSAKMFYKKTGFPEDSELVMCKVTNVQYNSVFVNLTDYDLPGMIHISEVSPGRIRNIRDYVKEGKVVICKVLRINRERKQIDLSLRRVSDFQRRQKVNETKQEQLAEKIVEFVAKQAGMEPKQLYDMIISKIKEDYETLYSFFEEIVEDESVMKEAAIDEKLAASMIAVIKQRIKPVVVRINGYFLIKSFDPKGVEIVREALKLAEDTSSEDLALTYAGAGKYQFSFITSDYKTGEKEFDKIKKALQQFLDEHNSTFEAVRVKD